MCQLTFNVPDSTPEALHVPAERLGAELLLAAAMKLYEAGRLSGGAAAELAALRAPDSQATPPLGYCFWSPSSIENFAAAHGFELAPGPVVLIGGSTMRCWRETAPPGWRRAYQHDAETPLEWSLRFLERGDSAAGGS